MKIETVMEHIEERMKELKDQMKEWEMDDQMHIILSREFYTLFDLKLWIEDKLFDEKYPQYCSMQRD